MVVGQLIDLQLNNRPAIGFTRPISCDEPDVSSNTRNVNKRRRLFGGSVATSSVGLDQLPRGRKGGAMKAQTTIKIINKTLGKEQTMQMLIPRPLCPKSRCSVHPSL